MMRFVFILLISLTVMSAGAQDKNPYTLLKYDSLVMYDFNADSLPEYFPSIVDKGVLASNIRKSKTVTRSVADSITHRIGMKSSYSSGTAACFYPHLGIVYYRRGRQLWDSTFKPVYSCSI
jgi:hypothetical protein